MVDLGEPTAALSTRFASTASPVPAAQSALRTKTWAPLSWQRSRLAGDADVAPAGLVVQSQ